MSFKLYSNVKLKSNYDIGDFVLVGIPPKGKKDGDIKTIIGVNAIIRSHTVIYAGNIIGNNFQTGHFVMLREQNKIGDNVSIGTGTVIEHHVKIGNSVRIHSNAFVSEYTTLEDNCWLGPNVVLTNVLHPLCSKAKECLKGPVIRKNAKIGANVTILPDINIGEGALVGAGSVVIEDVPAYSVVAGSPARIIKSIDKLICKYDIIDHPYLKKSQKS